MLPGFLNSIAVSTLNFALSVCLFVMVRRSLREKERYIPPFARRAE